MSSVNPKATPVDQRELSNPHRSQPKTRDQPAAAPSTLRQHTQGTLDGLIKRSAVALDSSNDPERKRRRTDEAQLSVDQYRLEDGSLGTYGRKAVTKHLLRTLNSVDNPITNSDLYDRTAHVVTCATDVRQNIQRAGAKFYISEKEYFANRQEKLKTQFREAGRDVADIATGEASDGSGSHEEVAGSSSKMSVSGNETAGNAATISQSGIVSQKPKRLFAGLMVYVNGYTGPEITDRELKRLISVHGGEISLVDTSAVTHILVDKSLSASKAEKILKGSNSRKGSVRTKHVVHVDWVLDSIAQGKKLSERAYAVIKTSNQASLAIPFKAETAQRTLVSSSVGIAPSPKVSPDPKEVKGIISLIDEDEGD